MLGTRPLLGTLAFSDATNPNVVVLSFETWQRLFHSSRAAVGGSLEFRADFNASLTPEREPPRLMTVIGVLPPGFELPGGPMDFYTPFVISESKRSPSVTMIAACVLALHGPLRRRRRMSLGVRFDHRGPPTLPRCQYRDSRRCGRPRGIARSPCASPSVPAAGVSSARF